MGNGPDIRRVALFALRLACIAPIALALWWLCMPAYAWLVGNAAALPLTIAGYPIRHVVVTAGGFLNTETTLGFDLGDRVSEAPVSWVVTNVAVYVALVLATRRLDWRKRLRALAIGAAVLAVTHVTHLVVFFSFAKTIARYPQLPTALAQIFVTLPFLLWIVLAYWRGEGAGERTDNADMKGARE